MILKKRLNLVLTAVLVVSVVLGIISSDTYGESDKRKVYMVVANKLLLQDIDYMENLREMTDESGIGLMNVRGASSYNDIEGFLTINASAKSYGIQNMAKMVNLEGENRYLYETRMGKLDESYKVGNIEFNRLKLFNEERTYSPTIGALGENLKRSGKQRAVYGNSDGEEELRLGSLIAMDSKGLVEYGDVESINLEDKGAPFGKRIDYEKVLGNIEALKDEVDFTVIDIGDLDRLSEYGLYLDDEMFQYHRLRALEHLDDFIKKLKDLSGENSMIIIVSPNEGEMRLVENKLSPLVIWTDDMVPSVLTSGSTRVKGLVTNMDLAPTISEYLGASNENYVGSNIEYLESEDAIGYLTEVSDQNNFLMRARSSTLNYYAILAIVVSVVLGLIALISKEISTRGIMAIQNIIAFTVSLPISFMIIPPLQIENEAILLIASVVLSLGIVWVTKKLEGKVRLIALLSAMAVIILADVLTGSGLARNSVMGYSPIMGARYFGIGNELSGLFLSSVAIVSGYLIQKYDRKIFVLIPFMGLFIMVSPILGANVGGSISFAVMAMAMAILISGKKIDLKLIAIMMSILGAGLVVAGVSDAMFSSSPTHLGKLFLEIRTEGISSLVEVSFRKLSVNIRLMGSSIWSRVLIVTTAVLSILIISMRDVYGKIFRSERYMAYGLISVIAGSTVGLLVNDSGVLLAAFANIYTVLLVIQIGLDQKKKES